MPISKPEFETLLEEKVPTNDRRQAQDPLISRVQRDSSFEKRAVTCLISSG